MEKEIKELSTRIEGYEWSLRVANAKDAAMVLELTRVGGKKLGPGRWMVPTSDNTKMIYTIECTAPTTSEVSEGSSTRAK